MNDFRVALFRVCYIFRCAKRSFGYIATLYRFSWATLREQAALQQEAGGAAEGRGLFGLHSPSFQYYPLVHAVFSNSRQYWKLAVSLK